MRVFSGIQPTSELHIGNYLGAIKHWVKLQKGNDCIFWIADLHSLTVPYEPADLKRRTLEIVAVYLAAGISPEETIIFRQSDVKEHTELAWLLSTITPLGDLERMTQFKDKSKKQKTVNAGLLNYPVLMAADILLYQTNLVPVGEDQGQHVELTREIAKRFNARFGNVFKVPEALIPKIGAKIMSLTAPDKKMSKSDPALSRICLFDPPEQIKKKIASSTTDSGKEIKYEPKTKPGISNLLTIYSLFAGKSIKEIEKEFQGRGYQEFKQKLAELLIEKLAPFRNKKSEFEKNPEILKKLLVDGADRASKFAKETMEKVRLAMGL